MVAIADTSLMASLYLREETSLAARTLMQDNPGKLPLISLGVLELRNAFNRAIHRRRITAAERDALWRDVEADIASGFLVPTDLDTTAWYDVARELSDRYTVETGARSLDLLHVAAAQLLHCKVFFSFDERQRAVAKREGLRVRP